MISRHENRDDSRDDYQRIEFVGIFLLQLKAASIRLNFTPQRNPAAEGVTAEVSSSIAPIAPASESEFEQSVAEISRTIAACIAARVQAWREIAREVVEMTWSNEGRSYTCADLDFEVEKRVANFRARYVADSFEWFSDGVLELVDEYVKTQWQLTFGFERVEPPRGAHLRVVR